MSKVIIRADRAGIFFGELVERKGQEVKKIVDELIIDKLDHQFLNKLVDKKLDFPYTCPTAENMVAWIIKILQNRINTPFSVLLNSVRLYETATSYAEWQRIETD